VYQHGCTLTKITCIEAKMAANKVTLSRKRRKRPAFAEVKGKTVEGIELKPTENGYSIGIMFQDRTFLSFDVDPFVTVMPELSDWKTQNYKPLKRWPSVRS
jgi:hypothetical protein